MLAKVNAVLTSGEKPTTHRQDASDFSRDHLRMDIDGRKPLGTSVCPASPSALTSKSNI